MLSSHCHIGTMGGQEHKVLVKILRDENSHVLPGGQNALENNVVVVVSGKVDEPLTHSSICRDLARKILLVAGDKHKSVLSSISC